MSEFTSDEIEYLRSQRLGRLATAGADGQPHVIPVTYVYNADEDAIDVGGIAFGAGKKWRDVQANPRVAFLVDESTGKSARAVEIRGTAEAHDTGGESINPRFPNFAPEFIRIRPARIVSWGIEGEGETGRDFRPNARDVA
ncbi:MAG TPA: PPOX class F420-dependent oxidoreductase [Actinomycetota bacterium]|nr:PPOX class F420-dependent oxidoreductase [Actinomycetota bacterium]